MCDLLTSLHFELPLTMALYQVVEAFAPGIYVGKHVVHSLGSPHQVSPCSFVDSPSAPSQEALG